MKWQIIAENVQIAAVGSNNTPDQSKIDGYKWSRPEAIEGWKWSRPEAAEGWKW